MIVHTAIEYDLPRPICQDPPILGNKRDEIRLVVPLQMRQVAAREGHRTFLRENVRSPRDVSRKIAELSRIGNPPRLTYGRAPSPARRSCAPQDRGEQGSLAGVRAPGPTYSPVVTIVRLAASAGRPACYTGCDACARFARHAVVPSFRARFISAFPARRLFLA
jgi:hypothetical protein